MYRMRDFVASALALSSLGCSGEETDPLDVMVTCTEPADVVINCNNGDEAGDSDDDIVIGIGNSETGGTPSGVVGHCLDEEDKCTTADGAPGWCLDKYESVNSRAGLACVACDDRHVMVPKLDLCPPGCAIPGGVFSEDVCQGTVGSGGCPAACCPICY